MQGSHHLCIPRRESWWSGKGMGWLRFLFLIRWNSCLRGNSFMDHLGLVLKPWQCRITDQLSQLKTFAKTRDVSMKQKEKPHLMHSLKSLVKGIFLASLPVTQYVSSKTWSKRKSREKSYILAFAFWGCKKQQFIIAPNNCCQNTFLFLAM